MTAATLISPALTIPDRPAFMQALINLATREERPRTQIAEDRVYVVEVADPRRQRREALLARMTPERRATYERIRELQEKIGPVDFNIVKALGELRDDG